MLWRADVSDAAQKQLLRFPRDVRDRLAQAIEEFQETEERQWSNIKALHGPEWKGLFRKKVGPYRIIFEKFHDRAVVHILEILIRSKDTCR